MHPQQDDLPAAPLVVRVVDVSKHFTVRRDNSLKDRLLAFRNGRRNREHFTALANVSIDVPAGHTVALIGHNGSGKSTLLKIIGGILDPSSGTISKRGRIAALLELGAGFHPDLSGRDNVFLNAALLGLSRSETEAVFEDIVAFAEIEEFIDTQVKFYSSGMYVRLAFAVAVHTDPDILLVDEVLAVGDEAFQRKCMDTIRRFQAEGRTILLVTHNLSQVVELADQAVLLHHGKLVYAGEPRLAVSQFRDLLEERKLEHELMIPGHGRLDPPADVKVVASATPPLTSEALAPGETLSIAIEITGTLSLPDWVCAIQIDNAAGQPVFGTTSARIGLDLPVLDNTTKLVKFSLSDTHFGEGKYFVHVSLMSQSGEHLFDFPEACSFNTITPPDSRGIVYASVSGELR